jgi:hypothetical protein
MREWSGCDSGLKIAPGKGRIDMTPVCIRAWKTISAFIPTEPISLMNLVKKSGVSRSLTLEGLKYGERAGLAVKVSQQTPNTKGRCATRAMYSLRVLGRG